MPKGQYSRPFNATQRRAVKSSLVVDEFLNKYRKPDTKVTRQMRMQRIEAGTDNRINEVLRRTGFRSTLLNRGYK